MRLSTTVLEHFTAQLDRFGFSYVADDPVLRVLEHAPGFEGRLVVVALQRPWAHADQALRMAETEPPVDPSYHVPPTYRLEVDG